MWVSLLGALTALVSRSPWVFVLLVSGALVWVVSFAAFGRLCRLRSGWLGVLGWFHVAGLLWFGMCAGCAVPIYILYDDVPRKVWFVIYTAIVIGALFGPRLRILQRVSVIDAPYRIARDKLALICRKIVVELAHQDLRDTET